MTEEEFDEALEALAAMANGTIRPGFRANQLADDIAREVRDLRQKLLEAENRAAQAEYAANSK